MPKRGRESREQRQVFRLMDSGVPGAPRVWVAVDRDQEAPGGESDNFDDFGSDSGSDWVVELPEEQEGVLRK
jgi:hypothetical protein